MIRGCARRACLRSGPHDGESMRGRILLLRILLLTLSSVVLAACATARAPPYPTLDPAKPVLIERGGYRQDGREVNRVELDARLLAFPDTRERSVKSYDGGRTAGAFSLLAAVSLGGVFAARDSREGLIWLGGSALSTIAWYYLSRAAEGEHRRAVEAYNAHVVAGQATDRGASSSGP